MSAEAKSDLELEIAHILFIDTVGYSKLVLNEQRRVLETLTQIVRGTRNFQAAESAGKLVCLPTGDGMALVFADDGAAPCDARWKSAVPYAEMLACDCA